MESPLLQPVPTPKRRVVAGIAWDMFCGFLIMAAISRAGMTIYDLESWAWIAAFAIAFAGAKNIARLDGK